MVTKDNFQIRTKSGFKLDADIFHPSGEITEVSGKRSSEKLPLVIFTHGFKGFKDWGGFPYMMERIASAGFIAASFNFSHNGVSHRLPKDFVRLDLFADNTLSLELEELGFVIDHLFDNSENYNILRNRIGLIGHSRGGGISLIKASYDDRIKCLITLASVSTFDRYTDQHKKIWRKQGHFETLNTRTNQLMRLNVALLDDLEKNQSRLDILSSAKRLNKPYLIVHGKEDLSVKYEEAEYIYRNSNNKYTRLFPVENTGHTFGVVHPFAGTTPAFEKVIDKAVEFLTMNLGQS